MDFYEERSLLPKFCQFKRFKNNENKIMNSDSDDSDLEDDDVKASSISFLHPKNFLGDGNQIKIEIEDFKSLNSSNEKERIGEGYSLDDMNETERPKSKLDIYFRRYNSFTSSPKCHCFFDAIFYGAFLLIFSYMLLCDFTYYKQDTTVITFNQSNKSVSNFTQYIFANCLNSTHKFMNRKIVKGPSKIEYLVIFWIMAFFLKS